MNIIYSAQALLNLVHSAENWDVKVQLSNSVAFWMFCLLSFLLAYKLCKARAVPSETYLWALLWFG